MHWLARAWPELGANAVTWSFVRDRGRAWITVRGGRSPVPEGCPGARMAGVFLGSRTVLIAEVLALGHEVAVPRCVLPRSILDGVTSEYEIAA